jgi:hypothetical protein
MDHILGIMGSGVLPFPEAAEAFSALFKSETFDKPVACGVSGFSAKRAVYFERSVLSKPTPEDLHRRIVECAKKSRSPALVVHVRSCETEPVPANVGPFHCRDWVGAYQGILHGAAASLRLIDARPQGDQASERWVLYLVEQVALTDNVTEALVTLLRRLREELVFSALDFLLSDGQCLWVYREIGTKRFEGEETPQSREQKYKWFTASAGGSAIVCTAPLGSLASRWEPLPSRTLAVFRPGRTLPQTFRV